MTARLLDGRALAQRIEATLRDEVRTFADMFQRRPRLVVVLVGDLAASASYVKSKAAAAARVGIDAEVMPVPVTADTAELVALVQAIVDHDPDYVVVGEGRTVTYEMVETAIRMVMNGAKLIATNLDPNCPTQAGLRPGCGAIVAMIETATGRKAFSVGKPSAVMMRAARKELGLDASRTTMIGDTMETDILGGVQLGYRTILVLSGGTQREDLGAFAYRPDMVVDSIADLSAARLAGLTADAAV